LGCYIQIILPELNFLSLLFYRQLLMREDGKKQVCIVGLQEFEVSDVQIVKEYIERGNSARSTGSTGANEESSRSHAILQLAVKKHIIVKDTRRQRDRDANEAKNTKAVGKISFIDLAGSERGADTTDNDRQTRFCLCLWICSLLLISQAPLPSHFI
jgi:kinesin family member 2/24